MGVEHMNGTITLKAINDILGKCFFIPDYQRGYRWGRQQVEDLLNDLLEFSEEVSESQDTERIYCLQPLVIRQRKNSDHNSTDEQPHMNAIVYNVIDGQQRLTTIKIILSCLGEGNLFSVEYQTRPYSKGFLDNILTQSGEEWKKNADFYHMYQAKETISKWLSDHQGDILNDKQDDKLSLNETLKSIIKERVHFVWYEMDELPQTGRRRPTENDELAFERKVFTRLNIGKIGLTEAELVKALFLGSNNFPSTDSTEEKLLTLVEIANDWDKIEYRLQDDRFWLFFHDVGYDKPTRIDFILDIVQRMGITDGNYYAGDMHPTFRYFYDGFKTAANKQLYLKNQWENISRVYNILEEWYNNAELYHYIGYLTVIAKPDVRNLINEYNVRNKHSFVDYLKGEIKNLCGNNRGIDFNQLYEEEGQPKKVKTKPILLLHNVLTLLNQNAQLLDKEEYRLPDFFRFPFHLFKKEDWEVEHIRPNSLQDYDGPTKKSARNKYVFILEQYQDEHIQTALARYHSQSETEEAFRELWDTINNSDTNKELTETNKNLIWNYTLLDGTTNTEYGNACFAIKRDFVLKKETGIKPVLKEENNRIKLTEKEETAFVPICTKNVFSKSYTDYPDNLKYWTEKDAAFYRFDMEKTLWWYLFNLPNDRTIKKLYERLHDELSNDQGRKILFTLYKRGVLEVGVYNIPFSVWYKELLEIHNRDVTEKEIPDNQFKAWYSNLSNRYNQEVLSVGIRNKSFMAWYHEQKEAVESNG